MKSFISAIVLLSSVQYAFADTTLEYNSRHSDETTANITYVISNDRLRFQENNSKLVNFYDRIQKSFVTINSDSGQISKLDEQTLNQRVSQLNQKRLAKIAAVEDKLDAKLDQMSAKEQKVGQSLINQLKYPDLYGEHTTLKLNKLNKTKTINNIECQVYILIKAKKPVKQYCLSDNKALNISDKDYKTLRSFYAFDYQVQSRLFLASGRSDFNLINYDKHNMEGVVLEMISYKNDEVGQHLQLVKHHTNPVSKDAFSKLKN